LLKVISNILSVLLVSEHSIYLTANDTIHAGSMTTVASHMYPISQKTAHLILANTSANGN